MKLALHIGTARTGTTSFQVWCQVNRNELAAQGICYPASFGGENHRGLMTYALDTSNGEPALLDYGIHSADEHEAYRRQMRDLLAGELAHSRDMGQRLWIMSSEHLHSRISSLAMIQRLKDLLAPQFDQITIYLHLRPQVELLISNATQRARNGRPVTRAELARPSVSEISNYFNYSHFVANWEAVFGADALRLVPYRRIPDFTAFMVEEAGIDTAPLTPLLHVNKGLDWRAVALANAVHKGFGTLKLGAAPGFHLDDLLAGERLQMGRALAQEVQGRFDRSNAELAARRGDITLADLTPDWSEHEEIGNLDLIEAPCAFAPQLAQMIRRFAQDNAMERWRRHIAEGRIAALTNDESGMNKAKNEAQAAAAELDALGVVPVLGQAGAKGQA